MALTRIIGLALLAVATILFGISGFATTPTENRLTNWGLAAFAGGSLLLSLPG